MAQYILMSQHPYTICSFPLHPPTEVLRSWENITSGTMNLMRSALMAYNSLQLIFLFSVLCQVIHCTSVAREASAVRLDSSSFKQNWLPSASSPAMSPYPMLSNCHLTQTPLFHSVPAHWYPYAVIRLDLLKSTSFLFSPLEQCSRLLDPQHCDKVISRLVLAHLNSSTKLVICSFKIAFPYNAPVLSCTYSTQHPKPFPSYHILHHWKSYIIHILLIQFTRQGHINGIDSLNNELSNSNDQWNCTTRLNSSAVSLQYNSIQLN